MQDIKKNPISFQESTVRITLKDTLHHESVLFNPRGKKSLSVQRIIIISSMGTVLSELGNMPCSNVDHPILQSKHLGLILTKLLPEPIPNLSTLFFYELNITQNILVIQYDQLYICSFEDSMINKQLNRLFTIHLLQQFLMTFGRKTISDFIHLDHAILNGNIEAISPQEYFNSQLIHEEHLLKFMSFGNVDLGNIWVEFNKSFESTFLASNRDIRNFKLTNIIVQEVSSKQTIFEYNLNRNKFTYFQFIKQRSLWKIIDYEINILQSLQSRAVERMKRTSLSASVEDKEVTVVFGYFILNIMYLPSNTFCADGFAIITVFKIRRGYQRYLARSDLNCILISNKYVRISRNDQNLSNINIPAVFPFSELDNDLLKISSFVKKYIEQANNEIQDPYNSVWNQTFLKSKIRLISKQLEPPRVVRMKMSPNKPNIIRGTHLIEENIRNLNTGIVNLGSSLQENLKEERAEVGAHSKTLDLDFKFEDISIYKKILKDMTDESGDVYSDSDSDSEFEDLLDVDENLNRGISEYIDLEESISGDINSGVNTQTLANPINSTKHRLITDINRVIEGNIDIINEEKVIQKEIVLSGNMEPKILDISEIEEEWSEEEGTKNISSIKNFNIESELNMVSPMGSQRKLTSQMGDNAQYKYYFGRKLFSQASHSECKCSKYSKCSKCSARKSIHKDNMVNLEYENNNSNNSNKSSGDELKWDPKEEGAKTWGNTLNNHSDRHLFFDLSQISMHDNHHDGDDDKSKSSLTPNITLSNYFPSIQL